MFRLESYLTPWLLGYLDKYVKLKPEDFQLSLWGGDAVFNNGDLITVFYEKLRKIPLDLRLNVIENLTKIPIAFKSGVIHELRIHIPWTRITSEPVVVTINTLEFVAKLKDVESLNHSTSSLNKSAEVPPSEPGSPIPEENAAQPVPTGYIQNIISKILFNICIIVNNVIVKFVEDDMVLSFNMKSAEFYSVNELWEKTFVDVNTQKIDLKKILQLNDVTICLDKMDNKKSSKISNYQDPLIYRCSIESRLDFRYSMGASSNNFDQQLKLIRLNFYCRKFDVSITDQQLPMVIRFVELIQAIVNGDLNLPKSEQHSELGLQVTENISHGLKIVEQLKKSVEPEDSETQQGWMSWAWSYVPSVSSLINEPNEQKSSTQVDSDDIHIIIGCYFDQFNLSFKLTQHNSTNLNKNASNFANFVSCYSKGIAVEVNTKTNFNHVLFGISCICVQSMGECCCKLCPKPAQNELIFLNFFYVVLWSFADLESFDNFESCTISLGRKPRGLYVLEYLDNEKKFNEAKIQLYSRRQVHVLLKSGSLQNLYEFCKIAPDLKN
ncbi:Vacuolar sorting-associated 13B [Brachionus plicatilis]|uniref:Vacuolar sorting-associated 13B n=1 Tax=Brachionus plicatilis TaxID=10195 RepID=A0A3M7RNR0_BRAPC|nr:Vacuolar sorting-associated 13B [Brachionus plicatilis]